MTHDIDMPWPDLMQQSGSTAQHYMGTAIADIDRMLGEGYAKKNPALIAAFMQTAALDFHAASISIAAQKIRDGLVRDWHNQQLSDA
jgi:hypothetical protein